MFFRPKKNPKHYRIRYSKHWYVISVDGSNYLTADLHKATEYQSFDEAVEIAKSFNMHEHFCIIENNKSRVTITNVRDLLESEL